MHALASGPVYPLLCGHMGHTSIFNFTRCHLRRPSLPPSHSHLSHHLTEFYLLTVSASPLEPKAPREQTWKFYSCSVSKASGSAESGTYQGHTWRLSERKSYSLCKCYAVWATAHRLVRFSSCSSGSSSDASVGSSLLLTPVNPSHLSRGPAPAHSPLPLPVHALPNRTPLWEPKGIWFPVVLSQPLTLLVKHPQNPADFIS